MKKGYYLYKKELTRNKAKTLQVYEGAMSWGELVSEQIKLEKDAKRYGLIKEFKNEGIL